MKKYMMYADERNAMIGIEEVAHGAPISNYEFTDNAVKLSHLNSTYISTNYEALIEKTKELKHEWITQAMKHVLELHEMII